MSLLVGELFARLGLDKSEFDRGLKEAEGDAKKSISDMGKDMVKTGGVLTAMTAPIAMFGIQAVNVAADFEKEMNRVRAVSGATTEQFAEMNEMAKELGRTTRYTTSQAADAMGFLAMAGFEVDTILDALPNTLKLAAAGNLDLARAADITTNILTGYRMEASQLAHANDVLVKTFTSTNVTLEMLGDSFKYAAPLAAAAGVEFEEVSAAIGLLGNAGIQGSMAGTSLRQAMARLMVPTEKSAGLMKELGLEVMDASGNFVGFTEVIRQLESAGVDVTEGLNIIAEAGDNLEEVLDEMGEAGASAGAIMQLFGARAGPAMAALVSQGSGALEELTQQLRESEGTAAAIAEIQMEGFRGGLLLLKSAVEGLQIALAESGVMEFLNGWMRAGAVFIANLVTLDPKILRLATVIGLVVVAAGPLLVAIGGIILGLGLISAPILAVVAGLGALIVAVSAAAIYWEELTAKFPQVQRAMDTISKTVTEVATAIRSRLARELPILAARIQSLARQALPIITRAFNEVRAVIQDRILPVLLTVGRWMMDNKPILAAFGVVVATLVAPWLTLGVAIAAVVLKWDEIMERVPFLQAALEFLGEIITTVVDAIVTAVGWLRDRVVDVFDGLASWWGEWGTEITDFLGKTWEQISGIFFAAIDVITGFIELNLRWWRFLWERFGGFITLFLEAVWNKIKFGFEVFKAGFTAAINVLWSVTRDGVEIAWEVITGLIGAALDVIRGVLDVFAGLFTGDWERMWEGAKSILKGVVNGMIAILNGLIGAVELVVNAISSGFNSIPDISIPDWVPGVGGNSFGLPKIPRAAIPRIPMLATGVRNFGGGPAIVGEAGPELVNLPRGSDVYPNNRVRDLFDEATRRDNTGSEALVIEGLRVYVGDREITDMIRTEYDGIKRKERSTGALKGAVRLR